MVPLVGLEVCPQVSTLEAFSRSIERDYSLYSSRRINLPILSHKTAFRAERPCLFQTTVALSRSWMS